MINTFYIYLSLFCLLSTSCKKPVITAAESDPLIASVGNRTLLASDLRRIIHPTTNPQDSTDLAVAYIDLWVRDQLMAMEATSNFSTDPEIEKLVKDYREKLLKFNLEEQIIQARFDTIITEDELAFFYSQMKEQFFLNEDIYRCIFARFKRETPGLTSFKKDWQANNLPAIISFANAFSDEARLDTSIWYSWVEISQWSGFFSKNLADQMKLQSKRDADFEYFLKIENHVDKDAVSPLDYIRPQLIRMVLHKRKQKLLEDYKQELYEKALDQNLIKLP